jgi:2-polyprenyl-3-methyl-5-hydroxy-6-metoxy-1,4-benzoquinol methylase
MQSGGSPVTTKNLLRQSPKDEMFERYYESFYFPLQGWKNYEVLSRGYGEWYYDCLPADKNDKILDIGCADGKFLFFLKRMGFTAIEGLELSARLSEETHKHVGCPVHVVDDTVLFLRQNPGRYRTITLNDVLEHIPKADTISFLAAVKESLMPRGNLVVNVPQVSGFTSLYCRYADFTHETLFTEMSLRQVLLLAGFRNIRFIKEKWPLKLTPRHLAYRLVRWLWFSFVKLIYFIEQPGEIHPASFQVRMVVSATVDPRPMQ